MKRRILLAVSLLALASFWLPALARAAEKAAPLEVTYYYMPG